MPAVRSREVAGRKSSAVTHRRAEKSWKGLVAPMAENGTLGAVVMGCGEMGIAQAWAMSKVAGVRIVGFQSASEKRAREFANRFGGEAYTEWNVVMATAILAMLPPALVVVLMQRWFVKGLVDTEK